MLYNMRIQDKHSARIISFVVGKTSGLPDLGPKNALVTNYLYYLSILPVGLRLSLTRKFCDYGCVPTETQYNRVLSGHLLLPNMNMKRQNCSTWKITNVKKYIYTDTLIPKVLVLLSFVIVILNVYSDSIFVWFWYKNREGGELPSVSRTQR